MLLLCSAELPAVSVETVPQDLIWSDAYLPSSIAMKHLFFSTASKSYGAAALNDSCLESIQQAVIKQKKACGIDDRHHLHFRWTAHYSLCKRDLVGGLVSVVI